MPRDLKLLLDDIAEAIRRIALYLHGQTKEGFAADAKTQDAVVRNLEVIGEATKQLPAAIRSREPQIPWARIAGLRDILIHHYFGIDLDIVWDIVENKVPELDLAIQRLIAAQPTLSSIPPEKL